ncbi:MAG: TonB-dependent receptor [Acidobacteriia bacterium]|nr:TonB-dependent receptor [Terriglobia bacterium]
MSTRIKTVLLSVALLLMVSALCLQAQDITKGTISGVVRDASGAIVAGAKVKLDSPNGDRDTITNGLGEYSFANLVVGNEYTISVEQTGFGTAKATKISVSINGRTTQDFTLQVGATSTSVEVTGAAAAIDLGTTNVGATLDESLYKNVPVGRNISALINMSPGVADSGGAGAANPSINGASGLENQYVINGANVTDPAFGGFGTYSRVFGPLGNGINFDFIQEVQVLSGGFEAQYGQALGGVVNVLTKSGGNTYHGSFYGYFAPQQFEGTRPDLNQQLSNKVTYLQHVGSYDFGGDMGGRIKKDKLFWYGGFNPRFDHVYDHAAAGFANFALGTVDVKTTTLNYVGKINYNINSRNQLEGSVFGDPASTPTTFNRGLNTLLTGPPDFLRTSKLEYGSRTWTGRYNGTINNHWVVTANFSDYFNKLQETPKANGYRISDVTPSQDGTGSNFSFNGLGFLENSDATVHQFTVTSSHVFSFLGGHTFEYGYQFEDQNYDDINLNTGADFTLPNLPAFKDAAGKVQHGAALTRTHPSVKEQGLTGLPASAVVLRVTRGNYSTPGVQTLSRYNAGFVQDSWTIGRRLTIKPGLRFEQQAMSGNSLRYVFAHNWAPRLGVIFDPSGNRKSKFFANWGRFYEKVPSDISIRSFSFETSVTGALYKDPGAGSGSPDLSAANFIPGSVLSFQGSPSNLTLVAGGTGAQYQDEVVGGYEHQFNDGFTFSSRFVYRHMRRIIEDISGISVTQALAGVTQQYVVSNPSAKLDIFKNALPCTPGSAPNCDDFGGGVGFTDIGDNPLGSDGISDGFPNASRIYKSMEFVVSKRFSNNFQVYANYTLSKLYGNFQGSFRGDNGQTDPNISSLFDFTNSDGLLTDQFRPGVLPTDRRHQIKLFSNYAWKNLNMGLGWSIISGTPISNFLDHPVYENAGEVPVGGRGSEGRTQWTFPLNLHADYAIKFGEQRRLKLLADLFNVGNQTRPFNIIQSSEVDGAPGTPNPDFLKTASFQAPFSARLGVRFEF